MKRDTFKLIKPRLVMRAVEAFLEGWHVERQIKSAAFPLRLNAAQLNEVTKAMRQRVV